MLQLSKLRLREGKAIASALQQISIRAGIKSLIGRVPAVCCVLLAACQGPGCLRCVCYRRGLWFWMAAISSSALGG